MDLRETRVRQFCYYDLLWHGVVSCINQFLSFLSSFSVNGDADRVASSQNLLDSSCEGSGHAFVLHLFGDFDDGFKVKVAFVCVVGFLVSWSDSWCLSESLLDQGRSGWQHTDANLPIDNLNLDWDFD